MNVTKRILVIDDEDQKNDLCSIKRQLKNKKVDIEYEQLDVSNPAFQDENANFIVEKFNKKLEDSLKSHHYDLILVDYNYGNIGITGLKAIEWIKRIRQSQNIILYSAVCEEVIRDVLHKQFNQAWKEEDIINAVNTLMGYRILKMCKRESYANEVIRYFSQELAPSPTAMLCEMLRENGDMMFSSCCPKLKGKTFSQIADILDEPNNGNGNEWLKAIFEQLIAYLVKVNG